MSLANMPVLTGKPTPATLDACLKWASIQNEDAQYMWGLTESGQTSTGLGTLRLALSCMGEKPPEIVSFGSSVGAADAYCKKHSQQPVCKNR